MAGKPIILVTGSNGQLGMEIRDLAKTCAGFEFIFTSREQLSITDESAVATFFTTHQPSYVINCAAYTAVDKAEGKEERSAVFASNAEAVRTLALLCTQYKSKLLHVSTDYVFDGKATSPYKEEVGTNPQNQYGTSKLKGEEYALSFTDAIVIRTSWVYSSYGKNFVRTMLRLMKEKESLNVVSDQYGSPTYAADLAEAILAIIASGKWQSGVFHFSNDGAINWYEFAIAIRDISLSSCLIHPIPTTEYPTPARRPAYSVLDKSKIQELYCIAMKDWKESLARCIDRLPK